VTFVYFRGLPTKGKGEFPSLQQYNLERGKVGKGGRGRDDGYGKWVELADLPSLHHPRFSDLFLRKSYDMFVSYKFRARGLTSLTCRGRD